MEPERQLILIGNETEGTRLAIEDEIDAHKHSSNTFDAMAKQANEPIVKISQ
ncbi:hypothetical protein ACRQTN_08365 [Pectobacterium brasiliense]|uniref:hypothetical protein n=1 Tax=Pectobacterium brasiliense TaxID=180957 RepID=UPI00240596C5|nr:hypothetical protein [Pectobacterium brasiliense]MDG0804206.1 hypothetical protein [Pectobacterium brasiliense]